jgi:hypothetical protein
MAIDVELAGLKAAGTYRFERDLSAVSSSIATDAYSNLRLIVGFSKKGPFNSVQLITSSSQFIKLYGNIDRTLERRGSYFHRSALVALSAGPILCLNLLTLDPERDQIMHRSISTNINTRNKNICTLPYQSVYNTDKFWYLSSESYLDGVHIFDNETVGGNNILNFTNVGDRPMSVLVKKASAKNTKGYEVTLNEWYGAENVPEYLNGSSFVSDYMVEVYVISGDFGPELIKTERGATSAEGEDKAQTYTYSDECQEVFSDETGATHPYKRFASDITYQEYFDRYGFKSDKLSRFLGLPSVNVIATYIGSLLPNFTNKLNQNIWIEDMINSDTMTTGLLCSIDVDAIESADIDEESGFVNEVIDIVGHNFHNVVDDVQSINFLSYGFSQERIEDIYGYDSENTQFKQEISTHIKTEGVFYINDAGVRLNVDANNEIIIDKTSFTDKKLIKVGDMLLSSVITSSNGSADPLFSRLTRVVEIKPLYLEKGGEYVKDDYHVRVVCADMVEESYESVEGVEDPTKRFVTKYETIDNISDRFHWTFLRGFKVNKDAMPGGDSDYDRNKRQNEILSMISETNTKSNLYKALIDRDNIQWRYVVDTFGYGIETECKKVYALLCKGRQSGLALVNMPSIKDFKRSIEPSFIDEYGAVKSEYIVNGGNLDKAPVNLFSLPKEENGASWAAYFYPYLKISDLATVKTVPPAAYVSNQFIAKYSNSKPWSIVAGPKRGVISGNQVIGVEGALIHNDREYLEPMGVNSIVWENGVGVEIFANKTAKQTPISALSSIHAREVCIYIQDNVEAILKKYNWEANTAKNREEIKMLVDTFLSGIKQNDGLYAFKTVMDSTNNTSEVIDRNMGVIDIYIEVVRGLEILAQRLTVLKSGSIESGNFE